MSTKKVKDAKISSNHTSLIEPAVKLIHTLIGHEDIRRVTPGRIQSNIKRRSGEIRVKIALINGGVLLTVVGNKAVQEVRIYTNNQQEIMEFAAITARSEGFHILFSEHDKREHRERSPSKKRRKLR